MKLLMVTHYFDSHRGGIELVAEKIFRGLAGRQCEVIWAAANVSPAPIEEAYGKVLPLNSWNFVERIAGLPFPIPGAKALRDIYSHVGHADIVLIHDCLYLSNIAAFLCARLQHKPVIIVQHIGIIPYRNVFLNAIMKLANAIITRPMLASAQQTVFISQITARYFSSIDFRNPPALVFNGVDTEIFHPLREGEDKQTIRDQLSLPRESKVVLFVGRFVEKKGISVMRHMVDLRKNLIWAFAGWGPLDPSIWGAANVRVLSNVRGLSIAALYRVCDLLVLPSTGEGFPLVVQEALASGLPVVCGAETIEADPQIKIFARGVPIFPGDDAKTAKEFISAIDEAFGMDSQSKNVSEARHAFAEAHYSWDHALDQYTELGERLITAVGPGAAGAETRE